MSAGSSPAPRPHTVVDILRAGEAYLAARGVDAPRRSVELLIGHVLGLDRLQLYLNHDRPVDAGERDRLRAMVRRRGEHEPIAYLLGDQPFRELVLEVGPAVLVPRPETEELVARALPLAPAAGRALDLGTGSGAIALSLAREGPADLAVVGVDIDPAALAFAQRNAVRHGLDGRVRLLCGDYWQPLAGEAPFDLVVSNPPYVDPRHPELVDEGVRRHEPARALFTAPGDPASAYRAILAGIERGLAPGGWLVCETGAGAAAPARRSFESHALLEDVVLEEDLAGQPRILVARRRA